MENLSRLAAKSGIQSTLVLSRTDGSIIKATGTLVADVQDRDSNDPTKESDAPRPHTGDTREIPDGPFGGKSGTDPTGAEELAKAVFAFIEGAEGLGASIDHDDDVKLLRMRTRKYEIVVVPGELFR